MLCENWRCMYSWIIKCKCEVTEYLPVTFLYYGWLHTVVRSRTNNTNAPRSVELRTNRYESRSTVEVKDEQLHPRYSFAIEGNAAGKYNGIQRTMNGNVEYHADWHARFGLVGAAALCELQVIQGPNYAWSAWKIAFFALQFLSGRLTNWAKIESWHPQLLLILWSCRNLCLLFVSAYMSTEGKSFLLLIKNNEVFYFPILLNDACPYR